MAAALACRVKIRAQLSAVIGVRAALDDQRRPFARRQATQVRIAPLRHQHVDVMFRMVHMRDHRHDAGNASALGRRFRHEHRYLPVARKVARAADAVHHVRAAHVRGVDVAVDIELQRRVQGDDAQAAHDFRVVADLLRTQHDLRAVMVDIVHQLLMHGGRQGDRRGRGECQLARIEQLDGAVLQHFRIHRHVLEGRADQAVQHGVGNGADARLQGQQFRAHAPGCHFAFEEGDHMAGNRLRFRVGRQGVRRAVGAVRDDDGGDAGRIDGNGRAAQALVDAREGNRLAPRQGLGHIDVVQAFQRQRRGQVDFDDDLRCLLGEGGGVAHRHGRDDGAGRRDGRRFDDGDIDGGQVTRTQLLGCFRQMLVDEHDFAVVDLAAQDRVDLERHAARQHARFGHQAVAAIAQRSARDQGQAQGILQGALGQRARQGLGVAGTGEPAHADTHAVVEQFGCLIGAHDFAEQAWVADTVLVHRDAPDILNILKLDGCHTPTP